MKIAMIVLVVLLNLGILAYFQLVQLKPQQPLPEFNPEKIKILTEQEVQTIFGSQAESTQTENPTP